MITHNRLKVIVISVYTHTAPNNNIEIRIYERYFALVPSRTVIFADMLNNSPAFSNALKHMEQHIDTRNRHY